MEDVKEKTAHGPDEPTIPCYTRTPQSLEKPPLVVPAPEASSLHVSGFEAWMCARGYVIVPRSEVDIEGYEPPDRDIVLPQQAHGMRPIDLDVPHVLECKFAQTTSIRVLQGPDGSQLFLFVRNMMSSKLKQNEVYALCNDFAPLANCILFCSKLPQQTVLTCVQAAAKIGRSFEVLNLSEVRFDKLSSRSVPKMLLLNEADIVDLETRLKRSRHKFPKLRLSCEATVRYLGLKVGMVVYEPRNLMYRLVVA